MTTGAVSYLDLVTKVGFGVIVLNARGAFGTAGVRVDRAAGTGTGTGTGTAPDGPGTDSSAPTTETAD